MTTAPDPRFRAVARRPRFYRYPVADPGFRLMRNISCGAFIGLALVAGRWAWCVLWADSKPAEAPAPAEGSRP